VLCPGSAAAAAAAAGPAAAALPDDLYSAVMVFEPNAIEIAMSDLRRVLRAEARHASKMRKRGGANHPSVHTTLTRACVLIMR